MKNPSRLGRFLCLTPFVRLGKVPTTNKVSISVSVRLNFFLLSQPQVLSFVNIELFLNSKVVFHLTRFLNLKYFNSVREREALSARVNHSKNFTNDFQHFFAIVSSSEQTYFFCFHF